MIVLTSQTVLGNAHVKEWDIFLIHIYRPDEILICPDELVYRLDELLYRPDNIIIRPDELLYRPDIIIIRPDELVFRPDEFYIVCTI